MRNTSGRPDRVGEQETTGVSRELMKRRRTERGGSVVLDEKAVRREKQRDVQDRRLFERTFLDENNGPRVHLSAPITTTMIIVMM